ncbi:hypothetical protein [Streptomyces sp. NRRL S-87]|uniref:hypothetical protein n=1 Tax=Streptomyces sp. NRRL S-87 TaxID=1463920 RepID=UPI0004C0AD73|nr:hypothetical protein [Streptomyces sp. NRRL S-87]
MGITVRVRFVRAAAALACGCLALTACGTVHTGTRAGAPPGAGPAASPAAGQDCRRGLPDTTSDDQGTGPDTTSDDQGTLPDLTSDDQGTLPDETSDDQGTLPDLTSDDQNTGPDLTSDDQGGLPDTTTDDQGPGAGAADGACVPATGPYRWFPMLREFRAHLASHPATAGPGTGSHVESVDIRTRPADGRAEAVVRVDYGAGEQEGADRTARAFAEWRRSGYGDHGHVRVLGPAKTTAELDW